MASITKTDSAQLIDDAAYLLANAVSEHAVAHDSVDLGGSHYHMVVGDSVAITESVLIGGAKPSLGDSAVAHDSASTALTVAPSEVVAVTDTVVTTQRITVSVADSAAVADSASGLLTGFVAESASASDSATGARVATIADSAVAADAVVGSRLTSVSVAETVAASDSPGPLIYGAQDSASVTDAVTLVTRGMANVNDSAAVADAATSVAVAHASDSAVASDSASGRITAVIFVADTADVEDTIRLPAQSVPNLWTNTETGAAATWSGLPFNSLVAADGRLYAAGADGLYELVATDDAGTPIQAAVLWDLASFGSRKRKRLPYVYVSAACLGPFTVRVANEQGRFEYKTRLPRTAKATNHRAECGRGLEAAQYRLGLHWTQRDTGIDHVIAEYVDTVRGIL